MKYILFSLLVIMTASCSSSLPTKTSEDIISLDDSELGLDNSITPLNENELVENINQFQNETVSDDETQFIEQEIANQSVQPAQLSGLMVVDLQSREMIPIESCVHVVKNDKFTEPTCLKRR